MGPILSFILKKIIYKFVSFNIFGGFWSEIKCGFIATPLNKNVLVSWKHDVIIDDTALPRIVKSPKRVLFIV